MRNIFLKFLIVIIYVPVFSQVDNEFWFAAPELVANSAGSRNDSIKLCFVTYDEPAIITVSQPANPDFTPIVLNLEANSFGEKNLFKWKFNYIQTSPANTVVNKGIHIYSTHPISAYYAIKQADSEIYTLKGRNAMGKKFIVPMQYTLPSKDSESASSVEIVATIDNTNVTITPSEDCVGRPKGVPFTVILNRGQSYALRTTSNSAGSQLRNTIVVSDKPVAVNSTNDMVLKGTAADLIGEQLVPVSLLGSKYIAVPGNSGDLQEVYLFATENNTNIFVNNGSSPVVTLNIGEEYKYVISSNEPVLFSSEANTPFIAFQISGTGSSSTELGGTILPGIICSGSPEVAYKPAMTQTPIVTILTKTENIGFFEVNGSNFLLPSSVFKTVPGDPSWSYCIRTLITSDLTPVLRVKNTNGYFHMGVLDGDGETCSYGYFSNFNTIPLKAQTDISYYQSGDDIRLSLENTSELTDISWSGPNGFTSMEESPVITDVGSADAGRYIVIANHVEGCDIDPDTISVSVLSPSETKSYTICMGNSINLTAEGYSPYIWTPSGLPSEQSVTVSPAGSTTYRVNNQKPGFNLVLNGDFSEGNTGFSGSYSFNSTELATEGTYTVGSTPRNYNSAYADIKDHTRGDATGSQLIANSQAGEHTIWSQTITGLIPGSAYVFSAWTATTGGGSVELRFEINGVTSGEVITPLSDGSWIKSDEVWTSEANEVVVKIISTQNTTSGSGICLDDIEFSPIFGVEDQFDVAVIDSLQPQVSGDASICYGIAQMNVVSEYETYLWSTGETTQGITVSQSGDYWVKVTDGDCKGTGYFSVLPNTMAIKISLNDSMPEICAGEATYALDYTIEEGELGSYDILYGEKARTAGFTDVNGAESTEDAIEITLPEGIQPDIYSGVVEVYEKNCGRSVLVPMEFMVKYGSEVLTQRWNDVIGVTNSAYNGGYRFEKYQWYRNGERLEGETKSYMYESGTFTGEDVYKAGLVREGDTTEVYTCDFIPALLISEDIVVQTLAKASGMIRIRNMGEGTHGSVSFWTTTGHMVSIGKIEGDDAEIQVPDEKGVYILHINTGTGSKQYKIIVE
ncbi:T9SS type A sorting domain-containing protein [Saccharicrinis sp. FJH2]|uniref:T9SS type A sorting domain-containing protein n=1 Tax=Saccharicrinis sp. FJH65 TaxID=3344659 RepID=UPI0035F2E074